MFIVTQDRRCAVNVDRIKNIELGLDSDVICHVSGGKIRLGQYNTISCAAAAMASLLDEIERAGSNNSVLYMPRDVHVE